MTVMLSEAIHALRREQLLSQSNEAYARLEKYQKALRKKIDERHPWDATLSDRIE